MDDGCLGDPTFTAELSDMFFDAESYDSTEADGKMEIVWIDCLSNSRNGLHW